MKPANQISGETFGVYVGRIPKNILKPEFEQIFAKYGKISSVDLISEKNCGFVNYFSLEHAQAALDMNNRKLHGSKLRVNIKTPRASDSDSLPALSTDPGPSKFPSLIFRSKESTPCSPASFTIQIRNLSPLTTKRNLTKLVEHYGSLASPVHLLKGNPPYAYVNYTTIQAANAACSDLNGQKLDDKTLKVKIKDKDEVTPTSPGVPSVISASSAILPPPPLPPFDPYAVVQHKIPPISPTPLYPMPDTVTPGFSVKQRHASAQLNKFLLDRMDLKLREFKSFSGSVRWSSDYLTIEAPSAAAINQFEANVLDLLDEDKIILSSSDWNKLMLMRPDHTSLFQQLSLPYRTNPNVRIELHDSTLSICIVGMREAVNDVKNTILSKLSKNITVVG